MYDINNIFSKIIKGEVEAKKLYEDENVLAFFDINPVAPIHVIIIPRAAYVDFNDFIKNASAAEISSYYKAISNIVQLLDLKDNSYRLVTNIGEQAGQTIFHFHTHIIGGRVLKDFAG